VQVRGVRVSELVETISQFSFFKSRLRLIEGKFGMAVYNYFKVHDGSIIHITHLCRVFYNIVSSSFFCLGITINLTGGLFRFWQSDLQSFLVVV